MAWSILNIYEISSMRQQVFSTFVWLLITLPTFGQTIEKSFFGKNGPYEKEQKIYEYRFEKDGAFEFITYQYKTVENEKVKKKVFSHSANYQLVDDTIKLIGEMPFLFGRYLLPYPTGIARLEHSYIFSTFPIHYRDASMLPVKGSTIGKQIGVIDSKFQDTSYYYLPIDIHSGKAFLSIEYAIHSFYFLEFLKGAQLYKREEIPKGDFAIHRFDSLGRLSEYCVSGWFDMGSTPWTIQLEYIENTNLIKKISHNDHIIMGNKSYEGTYQILHYDENHFLKRMDFYNEDGVLVTYFEVIFL